MEADNNIRFILAGFFSKNVTILEIAFQILINQS
jgi:hypothetical protein